MSTEHLIQTDQDAASDSGNPFSEVAQRFKDDVALSEDEKNLVADAAVDILRSLLSFYDAGDVSIDEYDGDDGELVFDVQSSDLAVLIGRHGHTLEAFQSLFSLLVSRKIGFHFPVVVDIEGYRNRRREKVISMARSAAARARRDHGSVSLPPMSAFERRLIHLELRDDASVETHSEGSDSSRHVVISVC